MHFQKPILGTPLDFETPLNKGLVLHLACNEGNGDKVQDLSLNGNHGTLHNFAFPPTAASGWNPGQAGVGLDFDGANDHIICGKSIQPASELTMSVIVTYGADPTTFNGMIMSKVYSNIYSRSLSSEIRSEIATPGGTIHASIPFSTFDPYTQNVIMVVYDGAFNKIYLNGELNEADPQTGDVVDISAHDLEVGSKTGGLLFNGNIDQIRYAYHALSAKEAKSYAINPWQVYLDE